MCTEIYHSLSVSPKFACGLSCKFSRNCKMSRIFITLCAFLVGISKSVWNMPIDETAERKTEVLPPLEWFGGPRGGDPNDEAFYELTYDENVCPDGLRSSALKNFAFFGKVLKTLKSGNSTDDCLRECFLIPECKSVNVYPKKKRVSELNAEDQFYDPTKLVNTSNAIYYDRIQCTERP